MEPEGAGDHHGVGDRPGRARRAGRALAAAAHDRARDRLLDRRGPVGGDRRPPARRHPARAARGRLAAAVLHAAALLAGHRGPQRGGRARAEPAVRAAGDPGRLLGRPHDLGDDEGGLVRGRPDGLQPVPGAVRAGGADVLAGGAAGDPRHHLLREGLRAGHRAPAPVDRGLRGLGGRRAVHAQLADLLHRQRRGRLGAAVVAGGQAAPQAAAARRPARLRRARDPLPAVGADDALPGRPHRRPVGGRAGLQLAARRARRPARQHAADRPADLRRRRPGGAAAAAARRARPRRRRPDHPRRAHAHDRVDDVAGLTGVGEPLPGRRAAAVPAARRRRADQRAPARASSAWCWW